jgi:hypothetical protein
MPATSRRTVAVSSLVACSLLLACSSSSTGGASTGDGGSGSGGGSSSGSSSGGQAPPPADAFVAATVGPGALATLCPDKTFMPSFALGTATPDKPTTVVNGGAAGSGTATVTCSVIPQGPGFDVSLSASAGGRTFTVQSPAGQGAVQSNGGIGLTMTFSDATGTYQGNPCTLSYMYMSAPVPVSPPVTAGRIWGHLSCPAAQVQGQAGVQCDTEADFLFEQCTQ